MAATVGEAATLVIYACASTGLLLYALHMWVLFARYVRVRRRRAAGAAGAAVAGAAAAPPAVTSWPAVTVQLPIYNEKHVATRVLRAACSLDYPRELLEIQVLDDSDDETREILDREAERERLLGVDVRMVRRATRSDFKAGALRHGLESARGELIAVFDADFVPAADWLRRTVPELLADPRAGWVQTRWAHLNEDESLLTRAQALAIDGHFMVEQDARVGSGLLANFNGTAGLWRRAAIDDAGGWSGDTLTEDLDLSYRAQLRGWRMRYRSDIAVPAELPADMTALKAQQFRWAKGSIQTALKLLAPLWRSTLPATVKLLGTAHLTSYTVHPFMLLSILTAIPMQYIVERDAHPLLMAAGTLLCLVGFGGPLAVYAASQAALHARPWRRLAAFPVLMALGMGIAVTGTRAVVEALLGRRSAFVRTPKRGAAGPAGVYRLPREAFSGIEIALGLLCAGGCAAYVGTRGWVVALLLAVYGWGFLSCGLLSLLDRYAVRRTPERVAVPARTAAMTVTVASPSPVACGSTGGTRTAGRAGRARTNLLAACAGGALLAGGLCWLGWPAIVKRFGPPPRILAEAYAEPPAATHFDHAAFDALLHRHVDDAGRVNYPALRAEAAALDAYLTALAGAPFDNLGRDEKLALLLNAYNAFTLRLVLDHYPVKSIRDIPEGQRWSDRRWRVGGRTWSLNDLEHEQIRPKFREPRVHFALVCAAKGCPPLRNEAYRAGELERQLDDQARRIHAGRAWFWVEPDATAVHLTQLYDWYGGDFAQVAGSVLAFVGRYSPEVRKAVDGGKSPRIEWLPYDWSLNGE